jgi:hypothetical protein
MVWMIFSIFTLSSFKNNRVQFYLRGAIKTKEANELSEGNQFFKSIFCETYLQQNCGN